MTFPDNQRSDEELLAAIAAGGRTRNTAIGLLFERHAARFIAFAHRRCGVPEDAAQDIVSDLFRKLCELTPTGGQRHHCRSLPGMWAMLRNACHDYWRGVRGKREVLFDEQAHDSPDDNGADRASTEQLEDCVQEAFAAFKRKWQSAGEVLELAIIEKWHQADLAEHIGRSYGATRQFLTESRRRLKEFIMQRCHDHL